MNKFYILLSANQIITQNSDMEFSCHIKFIKSDKMLF